MLLLIWDLLSVVQLEGFSRPIWRLRVAVSRLAATNNARSFQGSGRRSFDMALKSLIWGVLNREKNEIDSSRRAASICVGFTATTNSLVG